MLATLKSTYIKYAVVVLAVLCLTFAGYNTGLKQGQLAEKEACMLNVQQQVLELQSAIDKIEQSLDKLAADNKQGEEKLTKDLAQVLAKIRQQPITIIKSGKCVPNPELIVKLNEAIKIANRKN